MANRVGHRHASSAFVGVHLLRTSDQAAADTVEWDTELFDTHGFHSGSSDTITIPTGLGGYYRVSWSLGTDTSSATASRLQINGTTVGRQNNSTAASGIVQSTPGTITIFLAQGETLKLGAFGAQVRSGIASGRLTWLEAIRVGIQ